MFLKSNVTYKVMLKLIELGEASIPDLAFHTKQDADRIGDILRSTKRYGSYGVYVKRVVQGNGIRGKGLNIWAIDEEKFHEYVRNAEKVRRQNSLKALEKTRNKPAEEKREPLAWRGQILTRWQPIKQHQEAA